MTPENNTIDTEPLMETDKKQVRLVLRCIDFRTSETTTRWLEKQGVTEGSYHLYASAGASGNPVGFLETVKEVQPQAATAVDHEDCGFYKKNGDDSPNHHYHNLEVLGRTVHEENPNIDYQYHLLPVRDERHTCTATAIVLGHPDMVKKCADKIKALKLSNDCDIIARPFELSVDDETIWNDLQISLALHKPAKVLLFEKDRENAERLIAKIEEVAGGIEVESVTLDKAE